MPKRFPTEPVVESLAIGVSREKMWQALTSPRVIGEIVQGRVEMEPRPGREFLWEWGVWQQCAPRRGACAWRGTVLDAVPGSTLVLGGGGNVATVTVKGEGGASLVTVVHAATAATREDYQYGWADFLLKLKALLEGAPDGETLYLRTLVRGTPREVLAAWGSPAAMSRILPGKAAGAARKDRRFKWEWKEPKGRTTSGVFLEIVPGHSISFTLERTVTLRPQQVRVAAEATPYGALVSLEHHGLAPGREWDVSRRMWAHLLERLRAYFYFGKKIRAA